MILTAQVHSGFPPFYRRSNQEPDTSERALKILMPHGFGVVVLFALLGLTKFQGFFWLAGIVTIWAGLRLRQDLARKTNGPLHWVTNPWPSHPFYTLAWTVRWPMLVFDLWTAGISIGFVMLTLLPGPNQ